jgi:hypothetical protein
MTNCKKKKSNDICITYSLSSPFDSLCSMDSFFFFFFFFFLLAIMRSVFFFSIAYQRLKTGSNEYPTMKKYNYERMKRSFLFLVLSVRILYYVSVSVLLCCRFLISANNMVLCTCALGAIEKRNYK